MKNYKIKKIDDYRWEVEKNSEIGMRVPGIIYADSELIAHATGENTIEQVINVSTLPGIVRASFAMPDIHYGYGFPIGGVAAFDAGEGVISPGGVGFDISCGVRILKTRLSAGEVKKDIKDIMSLLDIRIPKGLGGQGRLHLSDNDVRDILVEGMGWAVRKGYGVPEDREMAEEKGCMKGADPAFVSNQALKRGAGQVGTLGSGNHFLEIQVVEEIYDRGAAEKMGLEEGQVTVMIHSGSRGLGHQICSDYIKVMQHASDKYGIRLPDRQLACAPISSPEGGKYYSAMACAVNYALVNRHFLAHLVRNAFEEFYKKSWERLGMDTIYDVSHNIAKMEEHVVDGLSRTLCVHRKGATRAFAPGHPKLPQKYREIGQPVIIPGDMGTNSYILLGTDRAMSDTFGSTCHGAGRIMSRSQAKKSIDGAALKQQLLKDRGIVIMAGSMAGLAEEAPQAYKEVGRVVEIAHLSGISKKAIKLKPVG
ncbi:MAG: RtcB family protein, partial [Actinobacteria bacterium]|nr:RtcB family protein [Actinomycetota bacterium]